MKIYALIPARGGSKGIPHKNMLELCGFPLIYYTIMAGMQSKFIDDVYVSSDSSKILSISKYYSAIAIERPDRFSTDVSSSSEVVKHFISIVDAAKNDLIVFLQPTSPLRTHRHIDEALELCLMNKNRVVSVVEIGCQPYKSLYMDGSRLKALFDDSLHCRRQDLPICYLPNGAIYIFSVDEFLKAQNFPISGSLPYVMSSEDSADIDLIDDFKNVEIIISKRKQNGQF